MKHQFSKATITLLASLILLAPMSVWAEGLDSQVSAPSDGVAMLGWANSLSIVEQLQSIHRFSQSSSSQAIQALVSALGSPFPLARRKASRSLLEKLPQISVEDKKMLVASLQPEMNNTDPVVQKNIVRMMADLNLPEAQDALKSFFLRSTQQNQANALDALSAGQNQSSLDLARKLSPFPQIRQAAGDGLK